MNIFVVNAGSSSLKYQLINADTEEVLAKGLCERIGLDGRIKHEPLVGGKAVYDENVSLPDHSAAISAVIDLLMSESNGVIQSTSEIHAVGHRVVHGGENFSSSVLINDAVLAAIEECIPLAPIHNPANISGISACTKVMGNVPQVAVFDTAFHQTMPAKAFTYALPYAYYEDYKVRRYGFHGTSHRFVSELAAKKLGKDLKDLRIITCHLGNGSSICAIQNGESVDTSMGFTPLAGLPMGTRSGDMDGGVLEFLMEKENMDIKEMLNVMNKKSGVLGISGVSSDFRDIDQAAAAGNERAQLALDVFCYQVAKTVGSYAAAMGGVDAIVFTAGVGENSIEIREEICKYLGFLGADFDAEANKARGDLVISKQDSRVALLVIPTNEELVIARDTHAIVNAQ